MDKKLILTGIAKYFRTGNKGNRYKIIVDDIILSDWVKEKTTAEKRYRQSVHDIVRNQEIEVRLK